MCVSIEHMVGLSPDKEDGQIAGDGVFTEVRQALDSKGLTLDYLINKLNEELGATFQRCFFDRGGKEGGAKVVYSEPLVDWKTRQTCLLYTSPSPRDRS